jgi:hypothetical protein
MLIMPTSGLCRLSRVRLPFALVRRVDEGYGAGIIWAA